MRKSPAANLFLQLIKVDLRNLTKIDEALKGHMYSVQRFLEGARKFYGMTRTHRNQRTQLNLYTDYPKYIEYIRYYTISLMDQILDQI